MEFQPKIKKNYIKIEIKKKIKIKKKILLKKFLF